MAKSCTNCGNQLEDNAVICPKCGASINNSSISVNNSSIQAQSQKQKNSTAIVGFVLAFLLPLVGLILSIIGLNKSKSLNDEGKSLSIAGIIISSLEMILTIILIVVISTVAPSVNETMNTAKNRQFQNAAASVEEWFTKEYEIQSMNSNLNDSAYTTFVEGGTLTEVPKRLTPEVLSAAGISDPEADIESGTVKLNGKRICVELTAKSTGSYYIADSSFEKTVQSHGCSY